MYACVGLWVGTCLCLCLCLFLCVCVQGGIHAVLDPDLWHKCPFFRRSGALEVIPVALAPRDFAGAECSYHFDAFVTRYNPIWVLWWGRTVPKLVILRASMGMKFQNFLQPWWRWKYPKSHSKDENSKFSTTMLKMIITNISHSKGIWEYEISKFSSTMVKMKIP